MPEKRDETFSKQHRLRKSSEFRQIFSKGNRVATRYFVVYTLPNHLPYSRLGVQVRARLGSAVRRNYMKRVVREVFRKLQKDFRQPVDVIFIAEKGMQELDYHQFDREMRNALSRYLS